MKKKKKTAHQRIPYFSYIKLKMKCSRGSESPSRTVKAQEKEIKKMKAHKSFHIAF